MSNRPTFYYKDQPVRAGGIIFYQKQDDDIRYLLVKCDNRKRYEDFGGRTDEVDKDYFDTVARELEEESNGIFKHNDIKKKIIKQEPLYNPSGKYVVFFLELYDEIDTKIFGDREYHDDIPRKVFWVSHKKITKNNSKKLTYRLSFKPFFKKIKTLKKEIQGEDFDSSEDSSEDSFSPKKTKEKSIEEVFLFT